MALEEHQSALDLIMSSYRDQVSRLVNANQTERDNMLANQKHVDFEKNNMPKDLSDEDKKSEIKKSILERKVKIYVTQSRN